MASRPDPSRRAHVLFVTRRFPPSVGGQQTLAADVDRVLRTSGATVELVALRSESIANLAWFLPLAFFRTLRARKRATHVIGGDAIAWAAVAPAIGSSGAKTAVMVHGLDLVFPNRLYQRLVVRWAVPRVQKVVANSSATASVVSERAGVDRAAIEILNPWVEAPSDTPSAPTARAELAHRTGLDLGDDTLVLTTIGRLVRRKGVEWFVENVVPRLPSDTVFLVAGEGPRRDGVERLVGALSLERRVRLLGRIDTEYRDVLLRGADICVLPNVPVPGDMEGFGIVAVEAATRGTLVIASAIEGIRDSVIDGVTGVPVDAEDPVAFVDAIQRFHDDRTLLAELAARYRQESSARFLADGAGERLLRALGLNSEAASR